MQFDFGQNWKEFSEKALGVEKIQEAKNDFSNLFSGIDLKGKSFLDLGFGQGLSLLIARENGAVSVGCDINPKCEEALIRNKKYFKEIADVNIPIIIGSILENSTLEKIKKQSPDNSTFDIVHSWGVLHHTGNMKLAIKNSASLVKREGYFILAIYNRHWTSSSWKVIKWVYCKSPFFIKKFLVFLFYPIIWIAKFLVIKDDPKKQIRGMDFYYNIIDWVGGYPYEYGSIEEIEKMMSELGFECLKKNPAQVPTGCNEFVFIKK